MYNIINKRKKELSSTIDNRKSKISWLPLKLGIGVVLLFAVVLAILLSWKPLQIRWHKSRMHSSDPELKQKSIEWFLSRGDEGRKIVEEHIFGKDRKWVEKNLGKPLEIAESMYEYYDPDASKEEIKEWRENRIVILWFYEKLYISFNIKRRVHGIDIFDYNELRMDMECQRVVEKALKKLQHPDLSR